MRRMGVPNSHTDGRYYSVVSTTTTYFQFPLFFIQRIMPSISGRTTRKLYPCSACFAKGPLLRRKRGDRLLSTHLNEFAVSSYSVWVYRDIAAYSPSVFASQLRCHLTPLSRDIFLLRIFTQRNRWNSSLSDVDTPVSTAGASRNGESSVASSSPSNESTQEPVDSTGSSLSERTQQEIVGTDAQTRLLRQVQTGWDVEASSTLEGLDHWNDEMPHPRALPHHTRVESAEQKMDFSPPDSATHGQSPSSIPPFISRELNQLRQHLQQVMTVLGSKTAEPSGASYRPFQSSMLYQQNFSNDPYAQPSQPNLPPLTHPSSEVGATLSLQEFLSLPLSAWDDSVWMKARDLFTARFHQLCAQFLESGHPISQNDTIGAPRTNNLPTVEDMQEIMDLLQCIAHTRPHTNQLDCLMYNFFTEIRATLELYKERKPSNKFMRNEMQVHPNFENQNSTKTSSNASSGSIGILAHLIENAVYNILRNRYWHLNLTTAYQTLIQVALFATVDFSKSSYNLEQQNPGANAEYWLKQQHQASRILDSTLGVAIAPPNRYDYTAVLEAWVATSRIEQLLQHQRYDPYDVSKYPSEMFASRDSTESNGTDADTLEGSTSSVRGSFASIRAGQLIRQWQFLYSSSGNDPRLKPTEAAYSYWLTCILNSGAAGSNANALAAARECHNVLKELSNRAEKDNFWPSVRLYNILMHAYARAGDAESAENVLHDLIEKAKHNTYCMPDAISFTTVINAWSRIQNQHNAPDRAERLFFLQQEFAIRTGLESLKPTVTTVSAVLQCWARSKHPHAATRVDAILQQMREMSATGHAKLQPNVITYNTCMGVWAKSGHFDAANRVENLFQELCKEYERSNFATRLKPDFISYVHRMDAWERATSFTPRAIAEKINEIFAEIAPNSSLRRTPNPHSLPVASVIRPNQQLYNTVIRAWSNCGDAVNASKYLDLMLNDYLLENNTEAVPNRHVFHFVMSAWSKRLSYEGAETAELWLNRMHHLSRSNATLRGISPNSVSYNTCLGAWSRITQGNISTSSSATNDSMNDRTNVANAHDVSPLPDTGAASGMEMKCLSVIAMERGERLFQRMKESQIIPDEYTYGPLLRMVWAQKQVPPPQKYQQARSIIDAMIRDNVPISEFIYGLASKCGVNLSTVTRRNTATSTAASKTVTTTNSNSNVS
jgi:pentatricopeptide repeat protein